MIRDLENKLPGILRDMADKIESDKVSVTRLEIELSVLMVTPIGHAEIISLDNKVKINVDYQY